MKFLVDMNLSPVWVEVLAGAGFEAVHWSVVGRIDAADTDVMLWAAEQGHVVLTSDLDFGAILAATQRRQPSVILVRNDILHPDSIGTTVVGAIRQTAQELARGAIVSVEAARHRVRILPLSGEGA